MGFSVRNDFKFSVFIVIVLAIIVGTVILAVMRDIGSYDEQPLGKRRTQFNRRIGEGMIVTQSGYYGINFVECESLDVVKRKFGALTLGAFNVLKIKNLKIVLPLEFLQGEDVAKTVSHEEQSLAQELVERLGFNRELLNHNLAGVRFSGIEIEGLKLSKLNSSTNVVYLFSAQYGKLVRKGLKLENCKVNCAGETKFVGEAMLALKPKLKLSWINGEMDLID